MKNNVWTIGEVLQFSDSVTSDETNQIANCLAIKERKDKNLDTSKTCLDEGFFFLVLYLMLRKRKVIKCVPLDIIIKLHPVSQQYYTDLAMWLRTYLHIKWSKCHFCSMIPLKLMDERETMKILWSQSAMADLQLNPVAPGKLGHYLAMSNTWHHYTSSL